jgi:hypothetical protein
MKLITSAVIVSLACPAFSHDLPCVIPAQRASIVLFQTFHRDTLWFGYHDLGTCAIDTILCGENSPAPPDPPGGQFTARWISSGFGCNPHPLFDYRAYTSSADIDTHRIFMEFGFGTGPVVLKWNPHEVIQICDSMFLQDEFDGEFLRRPMHTDSTAYFFPIPELSGLMLIRYGQRATSVPPGERVLPGTLVLQQNYPNHFNPSTAIRFEIPALCFVSLTVFDLLGRRLAVLVSETMAAGIYERGFNSESLPSGVYLCRLSAGSSVKTTKMLLLR